MLFLILDYKKPNSTFDLHETAYAKTVKWILFYLPAGSREIC